MLPNLVEILLRTPKLKNQPPFSEIGTRGGGSAYLFLQLIEKKYPNSILLTIDPYGDKPYDNKPWLYGNKFFVHMKKLLAKFPNHIHYYMTSEDFIKILDKVDIWYNGKKNKISKFSFIFLDGSHLPSAVKMEFQKLYPKLIKKGYMVVDNTDFYNRTLQKYFDNFAKRNKNIQAYSTKHQTIIKKL